MSVLTWVSNSLTGNLLRKMNHLDWTAKCFASGRWYPQPERAGYCTKSSNVNESAVTTGTDSLVESRKDKMPIYYTPKGAGKKAYALVEHKNGGKIANYVLFEDSITQATVPWNDYNQLTSEERDIYMKHLQAIEERQLTYIDPKTKYTVFTISHHLQKAKCCGSGCRHCPYEMINAPEKIRKTKVWNGAFYV